MSPRNEQVRRSFDELTFTEPDDDEVHVFEDEVDDQMDDSSSFASSSDIVEGLFHRVHQLPLLNTS